MRADLGIESAGQDDLGFVKVIVNDPVQGRYFQFGWPLSAALIRWRDAGTIDALIADCYRSYGAVLKADDIATLTEFLQSNELTELDEGGSWCRTEARSRAHRKSLITLLMHNYLFFRLPLVRPQAMLERVLPRLSFAFGMRFWVLIGAASTVGLYLSLRQWSAIETAFIDAFKMQGLAIYAVVLLLLKSCHEFGHGLTTVRYGCQVPSMGIAFMLGTPVLYTDTSDSWRLPRRSERLAIVFAGVAAEAVVATCALMLWPFLADGTMRQICFAIITSAVVSSVLINLNPFMRFDGYFALSDALRVPNLQTRAFELALWRLREFLFALRRQPPEEMPTRLTNILIVYAAVTAIYRVIIYIGIAAIIYQIGFKFLGILLGLIEIAFFILLPIWRELQHWWSARDEILARKRIRWSMCMPIAGLVVLCAPWLTVASVPAVLQARVDEPIHLPSGARLVQKSVSEGQLVHAGQILFIARSPDFDHQLAKSLAQAAGLEVRLQRLNASEKEKRDSLILESQFRRAEEAIEATERLIDQLVVRTPTAGRVVDIDPELAPGVWQSKSRPLARIVSATGLRARGVVNDVDLERIEIGAKSRFMPDDISMPIRLMNLAKIAPASNGQLSEPILAEKFGGIVQADEKGGVTILRHGWAEVHFDADAPSPEQAIRGVIIVDAAPVSPLWLLMSQIARVVVREHGF